MKFEFNRNKGVFPGISVQLFNFDTPVTEYADECCHALPMTVGAFRLDNVSDTKVAVFFLEDSSLNDNDEEDELLEEYRPFGGDFWIYEMNSQKLHELITEELAKQPHGTTVEGGTHYNLPEGKPFHEMLIELGKEGKF